MDIQNNQIQELFEKLYVKNAPSWALERDSDGSYKYHATQSAFSLFEQQQVEIELLKSDLAKAQAAPEGFVLIKASDRDQEMLELIDQRDHMESQAEELKDKLQALYGVDFGEHSSCNFPFQNAIDYDDSDFVLVPKNLIQSIYQSCIECIDVDVPPIFRATVCTIRDEVEPFIEAQEPAND